MSLPLRRLFVAGLRRRPLGASLSLLAIALGVALGLAVQLIHDAALDEFGRGLRLLAGEADLQVVGPREGFDDALYAALAVRPEVAAASPVLEVRARLPGHDDSLRVLGVDIFRLPAVQPALLPVPAEGVGQFAALEPDRIFLSAAAAAALGLDMEQPARLPVQSGVTEHVLRVSGGVPGAGSGQALAVMDLAGAQRLFGHVGRITRIELRLHAGVERETARRALGALLPPGVEVLAPESAAAQAGGVSRAYRVNLGMLAAIALLTGVFLVFSSQMLAVARRRQEFAFLRALGMTRAELRRGLLAEGAALGLLGGMAGVLLGHGLAALAFRLVGGDLGAGYFDGVRPVLRFEPWLALAHGALGVAAGLAGSWIPARDAARLVPARALRAADETALEAHPRWGACAFCVVAAVLLCALPPVGGVPVAGYAAVACILAAALFALPGVAALAVRLPAGSGAVPWRLARARLGAAPGQIVVAVAGVVASVALAVAMAIMVAAFRVSLDDWLARMLPADLYLQASPSAASGYLDDEALARVAALPGIAAQAPIRARQLRLAPGHAPVTLLARPISADGDLPLVAGRIAAARPGADPPVWISEAVADLFELDVGDTIDVPLDGRLLRFEVAGIWRDYARQHGALAVDLETYRALSGDRRVNDLAIRLAPQADAARIAEALLDLFGERTVRVSSAGEIRALSLRIFDRSFMVTYLMEAVAVLIGLAGIATSFAALASARRREFGMLRHLGFTRAEVGRLLALEGALGAMLGVALGMLAGGAVAWVLVEVINRQSFHWSMDFHVPVGGLAIFAAVLIALAAAAARLAGAHAMRTAAVRAVREDW
ncbi:FtsX-like permease family protein [Pseudothauera nasutitermitis]|uniref:FtsX-like permease family protein n=1 Tax=Pseudothauera nasutitermitis TaxID=2565930 RepID=A0A4V3WC94_9RHOO|nr:FtsX-like permease family protein [Pseudothauera nasutitermitis]THF66228.1 FtsX-like permease family protein [Pseudothauera nasutitermitis]